MSMNDPIGDLLTRIRNAQMRNESQGLPPESRLRESVLDVLRKEGYIRGYRRWSRGPLGNRDRVKMSTASR